MKPHTARWQQVSSDTWVLKAGDTLLATINGGREGQGYGWRLEPHTDAWWDWSHSYTAAQRAVRKALREKE